VYKREKESARDTLYNKNMEDPLSSLNTASHHFDNGQIKDAYYLFLNTAQNAIQPFFDVKFVHCCKFLIQTKKKDISS
jgi:uncharacterized protein with gpF-like domain